jgi:hypothetical protein
MNARQTITTGVAVAVAALAFGTPSDAQFGRGGGPGGNGAEVKLVSRFDKDGDGRLNREERKAALPAATGGAGLNFRPFRGGGTATPGPKLTPAQVRSYPATTPLYDLGALRTIFLQFEDDNWESEMAAFFNTDVEIPATMTVDGKVYKDVGVHFRGASSFRMVPEGLKRSLNISTDFAVDGQKLGGYSTLNLLNANNDPTFLRAVLYTDIARRYLPAPKMNYMRVVINGESWGVYLNAQQFNADFARENFMETGGMRWKAPGSPRGRAGLEYLGEDPAAYKPLYEIKTKDTPEAWAALARLCKVLNETPVDQLEAALSPLLDIDGALRFLAVEVALVNSDGYWTRASDYNLYRDRAGRFHVLPHDVNEGLGGEGGGRGGGRQAQLDPLVGLNDPSKPLRSKLLAVPALRQKYLGYVREIATRWMDWNAVTPMLKSSHDLIAAEVKTDTRKLYDFVGFEAGVAPAGNPLRAFLDARRAFLLEATAPAAAPGRVAQR